MRNKQAKLLNKFCRIQEIGSRRVLKRNFQKLSPDEKNAFTTFLRRNMKNDLTPAEKMRLLEGKEL